MKKKELDFYAGYRRTLRGGRRSAPVYLPALLVLLVGLCAFGVLEGRNQVLEEELEVLCLEVEQEEAQYQQAQEKWIYNETLMERIGVLEELEKSRATYPKVTSALIEEIDAVGAGRIDMVLEGYDAETGELFFHASSKEVIHIPDYVAALRETGRFRTLEYSGYHDEKGAYTLSLRCVLRGSGEGGSL